MAAPSAAGEEPRSVDPDALRYHSLAVEEEKLSHARREIYHSAGPGYFIIRGFVNAEFAEHMRTFWRDQPPAELHREFPGKKHIYLGCPNYAWWNELGSKAFENFLWNPPADEVTHAVCYLVQWLRNRIMGVRPYEELLPLYGRAISYRAVVSRDESWVVKPHRDWIGENFVKSPARLQATLFLSARGADYVDGGFRFTTNQDREVLFGRDVAVQPGDLVFWRYSNAHAVSGVQCEPGQAGFIRVVYPPEEMGVRPVSGLQWRGLAKRSRAALARTALGRRVLRPVYRIVTGRKP